MKFAAVFIVASILVACSFAASVDEQLDQGVVAEVEPSVYKSNDDEPSVYRVKRSPRRSQRQRQRGRTVYDVRPVAPSPIYAAPYAAVSPYGYAAGYPYGK